MSKFTKICISGMTGLKDETLQAYKEMVEARCPGSQVDILGKEILSEDEAIERMQGYDILMSGYQTMTDKAYAALDLKAFITCSIGFDFVNVEAATKNNVLVANNPFYCINEVAEHICALTLNCARSIFKMGNAVKNGGWGFPSIGYQQSFSSSTVGFYGFGRIPRAAAAKFSGFGCRLIANDPYLTPDKVEGTGVELVTFDELLAQSDYLILQVPLSPATVGIINADVFSKMKNTACIINTARGKLINQADLYEAISSGQIRGAALDVLCHEPAQEEELKLLALPNVVATGHTGFYSIQSLENQMVTTVDNLVRVLNGNLPENIVNRSVLDKIDWYNE